MKRLKRITENSFVSLTVLGVCISVAVGAGITLASVDAELREIRNISENNERLIYLHDEQIEKINSNIDNKLESISDRIIDIEKSVSKIEGKTQVLVDSLNSEHGG